MNSEFNPLEHPILFSAPRRVAHQNWVEHIPFAMFLVDALRPGLLVELGTYMGDSYCAFCQAIQELDVSARCYAVDTWEGDPQSGSYGPDVLADLRQHHDPLYGGFSRLLQQTFDEALEHFEDNSIDLLHIDGYHTYDAVKHDFQTWLPKLSNRAVVLFHDTNCRESDYGVHRFWDEIKMSCPHFEFLHGHGLGVLGVGTERPPALSSLYDAGDDRQSHIRLFFWQRGQSINERRQLQRRLEGVTNSKGWRALETLRRIRAGSPRG